MVFVGGFPLMFWLLMLLVVYMLIICLCVFLLLYHPVMNLTFLPLTNFHVIDLFSEDVFYMASRTTTDM